MKKKLTVEIAEGLGNQIFMYAFAFSISKKFNYNLFIDNRSGYSRKKNLLRPHQVYMLDSFNIDQNIHHIGKIVEGNKVLVVDLEGRQLDFNKDGWDSFK